MSTYPVLNDQPIDKWNVKELKDELCRRNLPIEGLKDDLVKRLFEDLQGGIHGGEETVGTPPDGDVKEDTSLYQASIEPLMKLNADEGSSEVVTQEGDLCVSVAEASKESALAATAVISQETFLAAAEVSEAPLDDVATNDVISVTDAVAVKGDDLEPVPGHGSIVDEVCPQVEGHSEIVVQKAPEEGTNMKMIVDDLQPDVNSVLKLSTLPGKGELGAEIPEQEAVLSPPDAITSCADAVATAPEQNSDTLMAGVNSGDNASINVMGATSVDTKGTVAKGKTSASTKKRKPEAQEVLANEPIKSQHLWNAVSVRSSEQQASKLSGSDAHKDVFQPARKLSFGRSDSTASGDPPKERIVLPSQKPVTTSLRVDRFVRPFTLKAARQLLGKTGSICNFWMDHIKTHCYVTYSSVEEAVATRNAVYNLQWPPNNGNFLVAEFVDPREVKLRVEAPPQLLVLNSLSSARKPNVIRFQQSKANQTMPPLGAGTSMGFLPTPQPLTNPSHASNFLKTNSVSLDDLFKKTRATPRIYYMPLSEEEVSAKLAARNKHKRKFG